MVRTEFFFYQTLIHARMHVLALAALAACTVALSAHVGRAAAAEGLPPRWDLVLPPLGVAAALFLRRARDAAPASLALLAWTAALPSLLVGVAAWLRVLPTFAVAYVLCCALILPPLFLANRIGLVLYDPTPPAFVASRAALYAALRALGRALADRGWLAPRVALLLPAGLGLTETVAMVAMPLRSYDMPFFSADFALYTVLKTAVLLAAPMLDDALTAPLLR